MKHLFIILIFDILFEQYEFMQTDFSRGFKKCGDKTQSASYGEVPVNKLMADPNMVELIKNKFRDLANASKKPLAADCLADEGLQGSELQEDPNKSQELMARAFIDSMRKVYWKMEQEQGRKSWSRQKRSSESKKAHCVRTSPDQVVCTHEGYTYSLQLPPGFHKQNAVERLVASICEAVEEPTGGGVLGLTVAPPSLQTSPCLLINVPIDLDLVSGNVSFELQPSSRKAFPEDRWPVKRDLIKPPVLYGQRPPLPFRFPLPLPLFPPNITSNHF